MANLSTEERITFINDITVPFQFMEEGMAFSNNTSGKSLSPEDTKTSATENSMVTFLDGVQSEYRKDVLLCTRLAEIAANVAAKNITSDTVKWYEAYNNVLLKLGWSSEAISVSEVQLNEKEFSMKSKILEIIESFFSKEGANQIRSAIDTLGKMANEKDLGILKGGDLNTRHFNISQVREDKGILSMNVCAIQIFFKENIKTPPITCTCSSTNVHLWKGYKQLNFDPSSFGMLREAVQKKLGIIGLNGINAIPDAGN